MLLGDEEAKTTDIDNDGDEDILFLSDGKLFLKENRSQASAQEFVSEAPEIILAKNNLFYSGEYLESVNNFDV